MMGRSNQRTSHSLNMWQILYSMVNLHFYSTMIVQHFACYSTSFYNIYDVPFQRTNGEKLCMFFFIKVCHVNAIYPKKYNNVSVQFTKIYVQHGNSQGAEFCNIHDHLLSPILKKTTFRSQIFQDMLNHLINTGLTYYGQHILCPQQAE